MSIQPSPPSPDTHDACSLPVWPRKKGGGQSVHSTLSSTSSQFSLGQAWVCPARTGWGLWASSRTESWRNRQSFHVCDGPVGSVGDIEACYSRTHPRSCKCQSEFRCVQTPDRKILSSPASAWPATALRSHAQIPASKGLRLVELVVGFVPSSSGLWARHR